MPGVGHYSGKLEESIQNANEKTRGRDGTFYRLMNDAKFYDIDDENNGLKDWQRAGVPEANKRRISSLCTAISDMIADFLMNSDYGVMSRTMNDIVNKLDARSSMNKGAVDALGTAMAAVPGGQGGAPAAKAMEQIIAIAMGQNPFDPDMIPPLCLNFPGLPIDIASCYRPGFFTPNWEFLYEFEPVKNPKFYANGEGTVCIGPGIPTNIGGKNSSLILSLIFSVPTVDDNGLPQGDTVNGVTSEQFKLIVASAGKTIDEIESGATDELAKMRDLRLTAGQMQTAYYKYIQLALWGVICNKNNWAFMHWGCIANNAIPEPVKTAVCSFIQTNGMALDPQNGTEACLFSYLINMGCAYLTGKKKQTPIFMLEGMEYIKGDTVIELTSSDIRMYDSMNTPRWFADTDGIPVNRELANRHFALAADLLSRLTYDSHPDGDNLRRRRLAEANLLYQHVFGETIKTDGSPVPNNMTRTAAQNRGFFDFDGQSFRVYENVANLLPDPDDIKIVDMSNSNTPIGEMTKRTIRYIARQAGLRGVVVTSLYRSPEKQGKTMFDNRQKGNGARTVSYAAPGKAVDDVYDEISKKYYGSVRKIGEEHQQEALNAMVAKCREWADNGKPVSKHGSNPEVLQAVDMGPNSMRTYFKYTEEELKRFHLACYAAWKKGYLRAYFGPPEYGDKAKDPAFHIEVWQQEGQGNHPDADTGMNMDILPETVVTLDNENLTNKSTFDMVFVRDTVIEKAES